MKVIAVSVFILFVLIFLGYFLGKKEVIHKDSIPDFSNLVLKVTLPVTVFCSIVDQQGGTGLKSCWQIFPAMIILYALSLLITFLAIKLFRVKKEDQGVWLFTGMLANNGFMGLPLALSVFGSEGMFVMALANVVLNVILFSLGVKVLTIHYNVKQKISLRQMLFNNINIAVVIGFIFLLINIPVPSFVDQLLTYIANITSGLSMIVVGLSLSRLAFREVFTDRTMFGLAAVRLAVIPLVTVLILRILPIHLDPMINSILIMNAALPAASTQSMITEQYGTNTAAAGRAVFMTTLFSIASVPLIMMLAV
ncbi:MAG: AEC family transporter [Clostridiales bacterium]|nr:AEC family transporter [Clostridiales bacterium]